MNERDQLTKIIFDVLDKATPVWEKLPDVECLADFILNARPEKLEETLTEHSYIGANYNCNRCCNSTLDLWTSNMLKGSK